MALLISIRVDGLMALLSIHRDRLIEVALAALVLLNHFSLLSCSCQVLM